MWNFLTILYDFRSTPSDIQVFEAFPKVVLFTDWVVGRVYEVLFDEITWPACLLQAIDE